MSEIISFFDNFSVTLRNFQAK